MATKTTTIKSLHSLLRGNYRTSWNEETDHVCRIALEELFDEIGAERLEKTVRDTMKAETFFQESSLRKHIAPPTVRVRPDIDCLDCKGTGWQPIAVVNPENRVRRCHCRRAVGIA